MVEKRVRRQKLRGELYHAGASRFALEDFSQAKNYLERFLRQYRVQDGWRRDAERMLGEIASSSGLM